MTPKKYPVINNSNTRTVWTAKQKKHAVVVINGSKVGIKQYIQSIALKLPKLTDGKVVINHYDLMWKGYMRCETKEDCFAFLAGYQKEVISRAYPNIKKEEKEENAESKQAQ
jgi:hypothetical protein